MRGIFWPPPSESYSGELPDRTDILVIGGGIAGTSLMHHLARRRFSAVLVESHHLAFGASGRNAGFLLAGVADCYAEAVRIFGRSKAREVWQITDENHDRMIEAVEGVDVGYRRLGSATFASGSEERARLEESAQLLKDDGFVARWDGSQLLNPRDGEVDPSAVVGALAGRLRGGAIREGVEVTAIEPAGQEVTVRAGENECRAGVVVLATNAYTSLLVPRVKIQPTRAQMIASAPLSRTVCDLPAYSHFGHRFWRQLNSGEVLIGGWRDTSKETEVGYDDQPTDQIQEHLDRKLEEMSPGAEVTNRWAGIMGFTETGLPLVGPVDGMKNVHMCAGFNGHGMGFAFMSARQLVESL
ncbi:MAG: NAD(P)/FAD-dependent oxidoreductase [Candidatus Dormibacteraceae bacterium]